LLDLGLARGVIEKSGNHLSFGGEALGNGRERSRDTLVGNPKLVMALREAVMAAGPAKPGRREADA
jgi:recombination protein RecA